MQCFFKLISRLPLSFLRKFGKTVGAYAFKHSKKMQRIARENLDISGVSDSSIYERIGAQAGIQSIESIWVWYRTHEEVVSRIEVTPNAMKIIGNAMRDKDTPVVFMTPHIGCFEILPIWLSQTFFEETGRNITILYRPPKIGILRKLVGKARQTPGVEAVPTNLIGVKKIIKNLRKGHTFGALPDQVPSSGEGVWAKFFGRYAYTMTLAVRVAKQFKAKKIFAWGKRTENGWILDAVSWDEELSGDINTDVSAMNTQIENIIKRFPEQYSWSYNRYKTPSGAPRAPED